MCIIIVNKKGTIARNTLIQSSLANPHGAGLMYALKGEVHVRKSLNNNEIIAEYYRVRKAHAKIEIMLHFRIKTDGEIDAANCHPYQVNQQTWLMHNGVLMEYAGMNTAKSDTRLFIADILTAMPNDFLLLPETLKLIQQAIGPRNKFVFLTADGRFAILNERAGEWDTATNNWFSNTSYKPKTYKRFTSSYPTQPKGQWKHRKTATAEDLGRGVFCDYCGVYLRKEHEKTNQTCDTCTSLILNGEDNTPF